MPRSRRCCAPARASFRWWTAQGRPLGVLVRNDLIRALKERGPDARVDDVMTGGIPTVSKSSCLDEAFRLLQEKSVPAVGVVDAADRLVGLVTSETIGEMLMLHQAMPSGVRVRALGFVRPRRRLTERPSLPLDINRVEYLRAA